MVGLYCNDGRNVAILMATWRFQVLAFGDFVGVDYPRPDHCEFLSNSEHFGMSITYEQAFYLLVLAIYTKSRCFRLWQGVAEDPQN